MLENEEKQLILINNTSDKILPFSRLFHNIVDDWAP